MSKTTDSMSTLVGSLIAHWFAMPVFALYPAWFLMLGLGIIHNDVWSTVPALGFWATWMLSVFVYFLVSLLRMKVKTPDGKA